MAGWIALGEEPPADPRAAELLARGWNAEGESPCEGLVLGKFYEASSGDESAEFYVDTKGTVLSPIESWPEAPRTCREISEPTNVEEIE